MRKKSTWVKPFRWMTGGWEEGVKAHEGPFTRHDWPRTEKPSDGARGGFASNAKDVRQEPVQGACDIASRPSRLGERHSQIGSDERIDGRCMMPIGHDIFTCCLVFSRDECKAIVEVDHAAMIG